MYPWQPTRRMQHHATTMAEKQPRERRTHLYITNIKNCEALLKKVVVVRAVTALKQQKSKGKGEEKGIAEIVHLVKPITRSPDSSSSSSSSSSSNNNNNNNNILLLFSCFALATAVPKGT
jgi:hypothetical protein